VSKKTKKKIVELIAKELEVSQVLAKKIVQMTFDQIVDTLVQNGRIELRKFGVFEVKLRKARRARNPVTNEPVQVPAKKVVTFQPGKVMEERVADALKVVEPKKKGRKGKPAASKPAGPPTEPRPAPALVPEESPPLPAADTPPPPSH
jgi:nucleoid DNA-binding protein